MKLLNLITVATHEQNYLAVLDMTPQMALRLLNLKGVFDGVGSLNVGLTGLEFKEPVPAFYDGVPEDIADLAPDYFVWYDLIEPKRLKAAPFEAERPRLKVDAEGVRWQVGTGLINTNVIYWDMVAAIAKNLNPFPPLCEQY